MTTPSTTDDGSAPLHCVVGQLLFEHIPEEGKLVIVHVLDDMTFCARLRLIGNVFPWPYWEISGTNGEKLRKASPHHDIWCYCPKIELPNPGVYPAQTDTTQPATDVTRSGASQLSDFNPCKYGI